MILTSESYGAQSAIPARHATRHVTGGMNISPQFSWTGFPMEAKSFVLTIVDKHPRASNWVHWMVINIPRRITSLSENISNTAEFPSGGIELVNTFGQKGYGGPQPPVGSGNHIYTATAYALDVDRIGISGQITESRLLEEIAGHVIAKASLSGTFNR